MHTGRVGVQRLPERRGQGLACTVPNKQQQGRHKQAPSTSHSDIHSIVKRKDWLELPVQVDVVKDDPDGRGEAHSTRQEKQQPGYQMAACTIDQALSQFDVGHGGPEGSVAHSDQAEQQRAHCDQDAEGQGKLEDPQVQLVHGGVPGSVVHQAVIAPVITGTFHPQACVDGQVLLVSVERDQSQLPPVGKQRARKEACYRGDSTQEGEHGGRVDIPTAHGRQAGVCSTASQIFEVLDSSKTTLITLEEIYTHLNTVKMTCFSHPGHFHSPTLRSLSERLPLGVPGSAFPESRSEGFWDS